MQKRHFEKLAATVRLVVDRCGPGNTHKTEDFQREMAHALANFCAEHDTGIGFNRARFLRACGLEE